MPICTPLYVICASAPSVILDLPPLYLAHTPLSVLARRRSP